MGVIIDWFERQTIVVIFDMVIGKIRMNVRIIVKIQGVKVKLIAYRVN